MATSAATGEHPRKGQLIEVHSIDYVPRSERHGKAWHLGALWFMGLAELATLTVGLIGAAVGATLIWGLIAIVLGSLIGTFAMAFHSVQGPRLGLPQMIQSRPQFGYYGALLPQAVVLFLYVGFTVFNVVIGAQALAVATGLSSIVSTLVIVALSVLVATVGYHWIHLLQRWGTVLFLVVFGFFTVAVIFVSPIPAEQLDLGTFDAVAFLVVFGVVAAYALSIAPYVSDYSRYLPEDAPAGPTFWWTYGGAVLGGVWLMALGAFLIAASPDLGPIEAVQAGADRVFAGFGVIVLLVGVVGMVGVTAVNIYGGSLAAIGITDTVKQVKPTVTIRLVGIAVIALIATVVALIITDDFLASYNNFLLLLLYSLTPWTAVNLVDYYFVRRGHYSIREIFSPDGMYGRWGAPGLIAYFGGLLAMVPFFSTAFFTGPIAAELGGADIAMFIGLPVSAVLYVILARGIDPEEERVKAEASKELLEAELRGESPADPGLPTGRNVLPSTGLDDEVPGR